MLRLIFGVIAGLLVGILTVTVVEATGHAIFPPPPGVNLTDPGQMRTVMFKLPVGALAGVLLGWGLGVMAGACSANLIAGRRAVAGRIVSLCLIGLAAWTMATIPHPTWFVVSAVTLSLAAAWLADRISGRPRAGSS